VTTAVVGNPADVLITTKDGVAGTAAGSLTITKMANNGTLELKAANNGATTVTMADATGAADSFNIATVLAGDFIDFGTVSVAGVETVNIMTSDSKSGGYATLTVSNSAAKAINVSGNGGLELGASSSSLKNVDASATTGGFVFTTAVDGAVVKGGSGSNALVGSGNSQTIIGGSGTDLIVVTGDLATLTGGAGRDGFAIGDATTNVNSYATITDFSVGDLIQFSAGAADFMPAKVTLGATAVFQDLANAAIANSDTGDVAWFQHGGDTYVIENVSNNVSNFINGTDIIVKIIGLVDFSNASFSSSGNSLAIG
jgi:S-layer protein